MTEAQRNRIAVNMERALERKAARVEENKEVTERGSEEENCGKYAKSVGD